MEMKDNYIEGQINGKNTRHYVKRCFGIFITLLFTANLLLNFMFLFLFGIDCVCLQGWFPW